MYECALRDRLEMYLNLPDSEPYKKEVKDEIDDFNRINESIS